MARTKAARVFGKWYGQRWADSDMESWTSLSEAKYSLLQRDNMKMNSQQLVFELRDSGIYTLGPSASLQWYADDVEARYIDLYASLPDYNPLIEAWQWYVDCEPCVRLYIGPRGGIREEKF